MGEAPVIRRAEAVGRADIIARLTRLSVLLDDVRRDLDCNQRAYAQLREREHEHLSERDRLHRKLGALEDA
jgi:hypothetical protein